MRREVPQVARQRGMRGPMCKGSAGSRGSRRGRAGKEAAPACGSEEVEQPPAPKGEAQAGDRGSDDDNTVSHASHPRPDSRRSSLRDHGFGSARRAVTPLVRLQGWGGRCRGKNEERENSGKSSRHGRRTSAPSARDRPVGGMIAGMIAPSAPVARSARRRAWSVAAPTSTASAFHAAARSRRQPSVKYRGRTCCTLQTSRDGPEARLAGEREGREARLRRLFEQLPASSDSAGGAGTSATYDVRIYFLLSPSGWPAAGQMALSQCSPLGEPRWPASVALRPRRLPCFARDRPIPAQALLRADAAWEKLRNAPTGTCPLLFLSLSLPHQARPSR